MDLGKHIAYMKTVDPKNMPSDFPARLAEAFEAIQKQTTNIEQQTNSNATGTPSAPPQPSGVNVTGQNGFIHVAIQDNNSIYRGINYHIEHADNAAFTNPIPVSLGTARHATIAVGDQTRYIRVASSYGSSPPSKWVYHGSSAQPTAVNGGGTNSGPSFLPSQGSGTGTAGQGLQGPGTTAFRGSKPPTR